MAELAQSCELIMTCLGNDDDVRSCYLGELGLFAHASEGAIFVDHTTTSATLARELANEAEARGLAFLDAPVSGGEAGAVNGQLSIMLGGDAKVFSEVQGVLQIYAKGITYMGASGNGQLCKMVNQICIAGVLQGLSEGLKFAEVSGLDTDLVQQAIAAGAAGSWQLNNRWQTMHDRQFDFGFAIDWMRKDLGFCLQEASTMQLHLPCAEAVDKQYELLQKKGENRSDTSVLVKQFDNE